MIDPSWRIEDPDPDEVAAGQQPALVSLHFLRAALRRRWRIWVGLGLVGMLLGVAWTYVMPAPSIGTVTLVLAHDPNTNPDQAMDTDVSLLRTRTVAEAVIDELDLPMTPEGFQNSVTATPDSTAVLVLDVAAPNDAAAVARAKSLSENYLVFRNRQIQSQANALINGYRKRVAALQAEVDRLTRQFNTLSSSGPEVQSQASDVLAQRSRVSAEISTFQQTIQDTSLQIGSVVAASYVLDPASAVPQSEKMRLALAMASGLVGGLAVGMGLVLFTALTSDRLRRREEVALALGVPVRFSVRKHPWRIRRRSLPTHDLLVLTHGLDSAIAPRRGRPTRLALATVDSAAAAEEVVRTLVPQLSLRGLAVFVVDLSESGRLEARGLAGSAVPGAGTPPPSSAPPGTPGPTMLGRADPSAQLKLLDAEQDSRQNELHRRLASLPQAAEVKELTRQRRDLEGKVGDARVMVDDLTRSQNQADLDVEQVKSRRRRDQERINKGLIKNPKDVKRSQSELAFLELRINELEDAELEVMEQLEEAQKHLDSLTTQLEELDDRIAAATDSRDEAVKEIEEQLVHGAALAGDRERNQARRPASAPVVFRPEGVPSLARGPIGAAAGVTVDLPEDDPLRPAWDAADVVLTLAEVDPAVGVEHLKSWAEDVVLLVTAGRSSAERLRTTAELIRSAGLHLLFAMMVGADQTDESLGLPDTIDDPLSGAGRTS